MRNGRYDHVPTLLSAECNINASFCLLKPIEDSACYHMSDSLDIDECAAKMHYCHANTVCVNLPGSYRCDCVMGFVRVDDFSCTEHDECGSGQHNCDENAICTNTVRGHTCTCKPGYVGNGTICRGCGLTSSHVAILSANQAGGDFALQPSGQENFAYGLVVGFICDKSSIIPFCEEGCRYGGTCVAPNKCVCPSGFTGSHCEKGHISYCGKASPVNFISCDICGYTTTAIVLVHDIDECAEGIIECHNHSRCVNLPGWYHCECRSGFHDNGSYSLSGESCVDIDECALKTHTCWNDSACVNLAGGFDCLCPSGPSCTGDCPHEGGFKRNGQVWTLREDRCSVCSCKDGRIFCRRTACDCENPSADLFCCPECDTRVTSQCLDQTGHKLYRSGDNWTYSCQQCRCLEGEVDCWPLLCPNLNCEYTAISDGECCPHCVTDPCLADNITYDIRKTCLDGYGITRLSGAVWTMVGSPCTTCKCKVSVSNLLDSDPACESTCCTVLSPRTSERAVQSQCAPDGSQYMVVFPLREMCWPKVEGGDGGAWISGIEAGEQCGKEKAVKEAGGQQKVGFICRMSTKIPFM
ncbi:hypothetical protein Q9233_016713 [Columba guinea]|nr:hypothetical protein Q9233_016713 [Columba guinea]